MRKTSSIFEEEDTSIETAYSAMAKLIRTNRDYSDGWLANITMAIYDSSYGKLSLDECRRVANHVMRIVWGKRL